MLPLIGFVVGIIAIIGGQLALIVIGFKTNPNLGCLLAMGLIIPFLGLIVALMFLIKNPKLAGIPFGISVAGYLIAWMSLAQMTPMCH